MEKKIELARKLYAMATKGEPGERESFMTAFEKYCAKNDLSLHDIDETVREEKVIFSEVGVCIKKHEK